jgi:hypothetical protein
MARVVFSYDPRLERHDRHVDPRVEEEQARALRRAAMSTAYTRRLDFEDEIAAMRRDKEARR